MQYQEANRGSDMVKFRWGLGLTCHKIYLSTKGIHLHGFLRLFINNVQESTFLQAT